MREWLTTDKVYEGFPMFLRRPAELDMESLRRALPHLALVTHRFAKHRPNGLPEPDYNHGLVGMDREIVSAFDIDLMGTPVLVETFGGERNYYFYVSADTDAPYIIASIAKRYPSENLTWTVRPDAKWVFIRRYAKEHF